MRKVFSFIFSFFIVCTAAVADPYRAVLVADMDTGRVLYSEKATDLNYPASLTKIMTLYLTFDALEHGRLHMDDYLIVSNYAAAASPVKLGLAAGSKITVEDAIKAVAVHSANDVARVLAENLKGGKEGNFASLMTRVAGEIGLSRTNFENSSGLPDDDHLSTARDIALMSMAVYKHFPQYWKYFGIKTWTYNGKTYTNGNRLLGTYPGCDGMKTGFTNKSKYSLVATASRGGKHLMAVVLGAENKDVRANVATNMLNKGFAIIGMSSAGATATPTYNATSTTPVATYSGAVPTQTKQTPSTVKNNTYASGNVGVQFGAFSSRGSADAHAGRVKKLLGVNAVVENAPNGMFRVRVHGLSESAAQNIKNAATTHGIDSFVFH